jgi:hypothetical protein
MHTATNVDATAVNTIRWLSAPDVSIVVPVYQRQYRWDIDGCEQLLADIRAVADGDDLQTHFLGSILSTASLDGVSRELVLIDGQQRITTLMLLVAALHHTALQHPESVSDATLASQLETVLVRADDRARTKLRPHRAWAELYEGVVLDRRDREGLRDSRFDDNYAFFRSQVPADEVEHIWRGLQRLEHVAISLGEEANAQQIFESLNSTGAPLRDHELIHNYVLMGLSHAEQREIEDAFWLPIEQNTGDAIGDFWRYYLIAKTGLEVDVAIPRAVYDAFRHEFPRLDVESLRDHATEWREFSQIFHTLLHPAGEPDAEIARHLTYLTTFGRGMVPLVMQAYRDHTQGALDRDALIEVLEQVQSLLLRRSVIGLPTKRLVARMCRARREGPQSLQHALARVTPSDARVRVALKYGTLPHTAYVLGRIAGVETLDGLGVDHVMPLAPSDSWSGDGERVWSDFSEDEQNSHRALAPTLGNLTLIEDELAERVIDASFASKRTTYRRSEVALTSELAEADAWATTTISERTARLSAEFLRIWPVPATVLIDDDGLTPILDAQRRSGWPRGWEREFEYVEYRGEHWEVYDVKYLFNRVFKRLWADDRAAVEAFRAHRSGPIFDEQAWNGHWDQLDDTNFIYMGWDSKYMLTALQGLLEEAGLASEVFVKYSYIGEAM